MFFKGNGYNQLEINLTLKYLLPLLFGGYFYRKECVLPSLKSNLQLKRLLGRQLFVAKVVSLCRILQLYPITLIVYSLKVSVEAVLAVGAVLAVKHSPISLALIGVSIIRIILTLVLVFICLPVSFAYFTLHS